MQTKMDISLLKENPDNPRTITDAKFQQLVASVKAFPQMLEIRPIAFKKASEGNVVLGGNMRLRACIAAGMKEVPVIDCSDLTEAQQREFVIKDNVGFGEWEWEKIVADWPEAPDWGLDIPDKWLAKEAVEDDYEIPDEIQTDIVLGDLFEIGEHRLLCGSSTETDNWQKLCGEEKVDLVITDPPYNVDYVGKTKDALKIKNDKMRNSEFYQFLYDFFTAAFTQIKPGGGVLCVSCRFGRPQLQAVFFGIWGKISPVFGMG